jgi:hypothetical protein
MAQSRILYIGQSSLAESSSTLKLNLLQGSLNFLFARYTTRIRFIHIVA